MRVLRRLVLRSFGIFNRLQHQQRAVQSVSQGCSASGSASQIGNLHGFSSGAAASGLNSTANNEANVYQAKDVSEIWSDLKGNDWPVIGGYGNQISANQNMGLAGIAHDGSYRFFKWDNAKGCMVPFKPSTPLKQRFQRSFDAFIHSWRLG